MAKLDSADFPASSKCDALFFTYKTPPPHPLWKFLISSKKTKQLNERSRNPRNLRSVICCF